MFESFTSPRNSLNLIPVGDGADGTDCWGGDVVGVVYAEASLERSLAVLAYVAVALLLLFHESL